MSERNWWIDLTARMIIQPVSGTIQQLNRGKARATYIGRVSKTWLTWLRSVATKGTDNNTFLSRPSILPCGSPDETIHHLLPRESDIVRIFSSSGGSDLLDRHPLRSSLFVSSQKELEFVMVSEKEALQSFAIVKKNNSAW